MFLESRHRLTHGCGREGVINRIDFGFDRFGVDVGGFASTASADDDPFGIEFTGGILIDRPFHHDPGAIGFERHGRDVLRVGQDIFTDEIAHRQRLLIHRCCHQSCNRLTVDRDLQLDLPHQDIIKRDFVALFDFGNSIRINRFQNISLAMAYRIMPHFSWNGVKSD